MKSINKKIIISGMCYASPLLLLLVLFFSCNITHAVTFESEQGVAFTFNPTVTISITGGTGASSDGLTITNLTPGDVKDSNIITVSASANTPLGYSLSSTVGSSTYNTTELRKDGTSTANKFTNLTTSKASLSNFDDNTWGYSYSTDSGSTWISGDITSTTNTGYNGLPIYTTSSPIKLINSSTAGSSSVQFKIGAKASTSQIAGTYNNVINFIGTSKVVTTTYTINYNDPSGEATVMPTPNPLQGTDTTGNAAIQISSNVPVRENYMFKGWCTSQTSDDTCSSDVVQPGGLVALNPGTSSATANVTKNLYAMWKSNTPAPVVTNVTCSTPVPGVTYMQELANSTKKASALSSMTQGDQYYLVDERDNQGYCVSKEADGNIWMTQNLDLDIGGTGVATLTSENTDLNVSGLNPYLDGYSTSGGVITWTPDATAYSSGRIINGTSVSGWVNSNDEPYSAEGGDRYYYTTGTTDNEVAQTLAQCVSAGHTEEDCSHYHAGNYYNWTAAIASDNSIGISADYTVAANSICPKGWKLPQGKASNDTSTTRQFGHLLQTTNIISSLTTSTYNTNGFNNIRISPLFFVRGGYVDGNSLNYSGSYGYYWSNTAGSGVGSYFLNFYKSAVETSSYNTDTYGRSARCMVR